jgi:hypothetical protein
MSMTGSLVCEQCWVSLPLGQYLRSADHEVAWFKRDAEPNSQNPELTRALWKFLAEHASHTLRTYLTGDEAWETVPAEIEIVMIGGDIPGQDPSFEEYLKDWPG